MFLRDASPRVLWPVVTAALVASAAGLATSLAVSVAEGRSWTGSVLGIAVVLAFCLVGALIVFTRPAHPVGWLTLVGGVGWAVGNGAIDLALHGIEVAPGSVPGASAYLLAGGVVRDIGWYAVALGLPIYFPTGRIAGPRWRWLPRLLVVVTVCSVVDTLATPDANFRLSTWHNPIALPHSLFFVDVIAFLLSMPLAVVVVVAALVQMRGRWRRGGPLERQQLALFAAAAGLPVLVGPAAVFAGAPSWLFSVSALPLPVAIGFAVLARGLYDLRTAVHRTLVWTLLSVVVAGIYALVIAAVGGVLDLGTAAWLPAVAVGVVAVSFAPLRDLLQRGVNRLLYGRWDEPYDVLARLGQRLEATSDAERLLTDAATELAGLGLRDVVIGDAHGHRLAGSPASSDVEAGAAEELALSAYGERVGSLRFRAPSALRASDRRLLEDLAGHLGSVLHDHRLTGELQRALERVVLAREEERRRLRRDLHDGLGPALAGHMLRLDVVARELPPDSHALDLVTSLREDIRATVLDVRRVVEGLRPPALDDLGLAAALEQAVSRLTGGTSLAVDVTISPLPSLPAATEVAVFRIVTEAVTNVVRHAGATHCGVVVSASARALRVVVDDDGRGLDEISTSGHGLHTMRERAEEVRGTLQVLSAGGTAVIAELPLAPPAVSEAPASEAPASEAPVSEAPASESPASARAVTEAGGAPIREVAP